MRARVVAWIAFAIVLAATLRAAHAEPRIVRGVVTAAETGRFVIGATVLTDRGDVAVTDADGYFSVTIDSAVLATTRGRELTITAPGFATQTVRVPVADNGLL